LTSRDLVGLDVGLEAYKNRRRTGVNRSLFGMIRR
jgi:hypothetical protein